jgi:hypothetical protein
MANSGKDPLPYRITLFRFVPIITAFAISLCLFWYGRDGFAHPIRRALAMEVRGPERPGSWWAIFAGASCMGAVLGATIGRVFRDERGGAASMGAFVGALAGPPIVLILFVALLFGIWIWMGCPG